MKKIFIVMLLLLSLLGCSKNDKISKSIYISSIALEYKDDMYHGYFLIAKELNSKDDNEKSSIASSKGNTILDIFKSINKSVSMNINMKHTSTVVLHTSMLKKIHIDELINVTLNSIDIGYNYYIFTTNDNPKDVLNIKNPSGDPLVMSVLVEPIYSSYDYYSILPIHFVNFCREYYNLKSIKIPFLRISNVWDEITLFVDGITIYFNDYYEMYYSDTDYKYLLSHNKLEDVIDDENIVLIDYSCKINKNIINISYNLLDDEMDNIKELIKNKILKILANSLCDPLNLIYYGLNNEGVIINIKEKK